MNAELKGEMIFLRREISWLRNSGSLCGDAYENAARFRWMGKMQSRLKELEALEASEPSTEELAAA